LELPLESELVVVAEISRPWGERSYRHLYTALVPTGLVTSITATPVQIGSEVRATGPHPAARPSSEDPWYSPRFYIDAGGLIPRDFEPLCVAWSSANHTYLSPDQGFLMTYGLIPRTVTTELGQEIRWDDPSTPRYDVVISLPVSIYDFPAISPAYVKIHRDYLQDYSALRGLSLVQVYYVEAWQDPPSDMENFYQLHGGDRVYLPGRMLRIYRQEGPTSFLAQVWGSRELITPSISPITEGRWDYGELTWPGIDKPVTEDLASSPGLPHAYVTDAVLGRYEGRPEFKIHPESL